ncbi:MAG: glycosyltransferase family 2 protein [Saprospiraceae bacterium]|nr:glycosyltransferase family 2 protein [Saprospiraceae bacterium]
MAIILICWNDEADTIQTLEFLMSEAPSDTLIYIVDNGSIPPFGPDISTDSSIQILRAGKNLGFAGAHNLAIQSLMDSNVDYILLMNTDVRFKVGRLKAFLSFHTSEGQTEIYGPVIIEGNRKYYGGRDPGLYINTRIETLERPDYIPGTFFLCPVAVFRKVGLFDERFFFSGEVADLCFRAVLAGYSLRIDQDIEVTHLINSKSKLRNGLYTYYNLRNRFLFVRKHHKSRQTGLIFTWLLRGLRMAVGSFVQGNWQRTIAVIRALNDGVFAKYGNRNDRFI